MSLRGRILKSLLTAKILLATLLLSGNVWATAYIDRTDCELAWLMENDKDPIDDSSSNSHTGTAGGDPTHSTASPPAGGFSTGYWDYDGSGDEHKNVDGVSTIDVNTTQLVCWINPDVENAGDHAVGTATGSGSGQNVFRILPAGNQGGDPFRITCRASGDNGIWDTDTNFAPGTWYHVTASLDKSNINNVPVVYVNGVERTIGNGLTEITAPTGAYVNTGVDSFFAGENANGGEDFDGQLDEVAIFTSELTSTDINNIKDSGLSSDDGGGASGPKKGAVIVITRRNDGDIFSNTN